MIGDFVLDIGPMFRDAELTDRTQVLHREAWESYLAPELKRRGYAEIDADPDTSEEEKAKAKKEVDAKVADVEWEPHDKEKNPKEELFWVPVRRIV